MLRPKTYRLEKLTSNGLMYWTITVHGLVTRVKGNISELVQRDFPSPFDAWEQIPLDAK